MGATKVIRYDLSAVKSNGVAGTVLLLVAF